MKTLRRPKTSPRAPDVTITAAPMREYPVTAHCRVATDVPVSWLIAGNRMLTADVLAFTTSVDTHVAAMTPAPARRPRSVASDMRSL